MAQGCSPPTGPRMNRALFLALGLISLCSPGARVARAASPRAEARAIAQQGDEQFYAGRCDKAIALWRKAYDVFHAPTILLRIARCEALLGHVVAAAATLEAIVAEPSQPDARDDDAHAPASPAPPRAPPPPVFTAAREEARRNLVRVRGRIATLQTSTSTRAARRALPVAVEIEIRRRARALERRARPHRPRRAPGPRARRGVDMGARGRTSTTARSARWTSPSWSSRSPPSRRPSAPRASPPSASAWPRW